MISADCEDSGLMPVKLLGGMDSQGYSRCLEEKVQNVGLISSLSMNYK